MFDVKDTSEENIELALQLHMEYSCSIADMTVYEDVMQKTNSYKSEIIQKHQYIQAFLTDYFKSRRDTSSNAVMSANDILQRRQFLKNSLSDNGEDIKEELVNIGLNFIHEHFNNGKLFPIGTFFSLIAGSGVGKSDYLYRMINSFLIQNYKVLAVSLEFGESRMATILDTVENGGKDRFSGARELNKLDNLFINFGARTLKNLELLIDVAHQQGVRAVFIDSFGEITREGGSEYQLQQEYAIMLNAKANDYNMFICTIAQTKTGESEGQYTVRGGEDLFYKPDLSIHIKKIKAEDISGDRIVHLFKNRDADINGKTIITQYDFEKREPTFKDDYMGILVDGTPVRKGNFGKK